MKREITLADRAFEIRTDDWPFADDEQYCLDLVEAELIRLADERRDQACELALALEAGRVDRAIADILTEAWREAAADYEFGVNEFECVLELRPAFSRVVSA
jgi:hypothetical protein